MEMGNTQFYLKLAKAQISLSVEAQDLPD